MSANYKPVGSFDQLRARGGADGIQEMTFNQWLMKEKGVTPKEFESMSDIRQETFVEGYANYLRTR